MDALKNTMKKILVSILLLSLQSVMIAQEESKITSASISFNFIEKDVGGSIGGFNSTSKINWEKPESSVISGSVETETIKTGNFLRDWSLKGSKYFNVDEFPKITFKSDKVKIENSSILVDGLLTIKGISKPIQIRFKKDGKNLVGSTTLFSSDYDITVLKKGKESNKVAVKFTLKMD